MEVLIQPQTQVLHHIAPECSSSYTFQITVEEVCGYAMLDIYGIHFVHVLTEELRKNFLYRPELEVAENSKSELNPRTDGAILTVVDSDKGTSKLKIIWWHTIEAKLTEEHLVDHTKFVVNVVSNTLSIPDWHLK